MGAFAFVCFLFLALPATAMSGSDYSKLDANSRNIFLLGVVNIYSRYGSVFSGFKSDCGNGYVMDLILRNATSLDGELDKFAAHTYDNVEPFIITYIGQHCRPEMSLASFLVHPYLYQDDLKDGGAATLFFRGALGGAATIAANYAPLNTARCVVAQYKDAMKLPETNQPRKNGYLFDQAINVRHGSDAGVALILSNSLRTLCP